MKSTDLNKPVYQLIVLPNTGIQICRSFKSPHYPKEELRKATMRLAKEQADSEIIKLITDHIPCNRAIEATSWIACDPNDFAFFRLTWVGTEPYLDLIVDTQNGGGSQVNNKIPILLESGFWPLRRQYHLADIYVNEHCKAGNELGSLIIDFGNSGSTFVFSKAGAGPLRARIVEFNNPFDPRFKERSESGRSIVRSNMIVLRVGKAAESPWIVLGERAQELIREYPFTTYLYAPKKYIRHWPDHLKAQEPAMIFRGISGQVDGLHPMLVFVQRTLEAMLEQVIASLANPRGNSDAPEFYPQVTRLMLTYPLTWREVDRTIFRTMLEEACARLLYQEPRIKEQFKVELVCSEPVAVAAYVLWENFFHFGTKNLPLAASTLGNIRGTPELRLLVLDIGGGSTDIAYVDIAWSIKADDNSVDVTFKMLESMRFNRAGDRISHLIATAIWEFIRQKYDIDESLDFGVESKDSAFTKSYKRQAVSEISQLAEAAKVAIGSEQGCWVLEPATEHELIRPFLPLLKGGESELQRKAGQEPQLRLEREVLKAWVEADCQSLETNSEPGFMDIFLYLEELGDTLKANNRTPHLVILSGRSTRLSFIREMVARHLQLPIHRVRGLSQILPESLRVLKYSNMDKLAVVFGAQRFRFGDHIRFISLPDVPIFNRYIGTVQETPDGLRLNKIFIRPGETRPATIAVMVNPSQDIRIGHAFRQEGLAQIIANLSSNDPSSSQETKLTVMDDYTVKMEPHETIFLTEWVPGGSDFIVDNFNDTGRIDMEPDGFIGRIVRQNQNHWLQGVSN